MRPIPVHPLIGAFLVAAVLPAAHAAQASVGSGTLNNGTTFSVRYVNNQFVAVNGSTPGRSPGLNVPIDISAATVGDGDTGIKSFSVWLKVEAQDAFGATSVDGHKTTRNNAFAKTPYEVGQYGYVGYPAVQQADVQVDVPLSAMLATAAARCNANVASLMAAGMSRQQAVSQDRKITLAVKPVLRYVLFPTNTVTVEPSRPGRTTARWTSSARRPVLARRRAAPPRPRPATPAPARAPRC